mmetsp:Transcript_16709/g.27647  ORF Transcript_16709/g.27647 Transcript_16709/m.27647 type:complete len:473 (+) Transcript_16709:192-1610(+)|eukprot:CAMPEP_0184643978 /NCGR_PEP_ID=MMETSP0308-20130426/770_1 /TAXON_ID=38269 /ORGANISM="Gloeochaete witrockiana, Strain SAG 46.84" /LENGTH=472 /DNA_ID=CAMNT_0027072255 /DNA_START=81 /DNA_END=1499 /DNA_ORIENTATION=-
MVFYRVSLVCAFFLFALASVSASDDVFPASGAASSCVKILGEVNFNKPKSSKCIPSEDALVSGGIPNVKSLMYAAGLVYVPSGYSLAFFAKIETGYPLESTHIFFNDNNFVDYEMGKLPTAGSFTYNDTVQQDGIVHQVTLPRCYDADTLVGFLIISTYIGNAALPNNGATVEVEAIAVPCGPNSPDPVVYGDPHVRTFDGVGVTYISCGDHVMAAAKDGFMYQSRFCLRGNDASSTCAVSVQCDDSSDVVELYTIGDKAKLVVAGKEVRLPNAAAYSAVGVLVERENERYDIRCNSGAELSSAVRNDNSQFYLDSSLRMPSTYIGTTSGLLGSWDGRMENDVAYRDGKLWSEGHGLDYINAVDHPSISDVQASWQVSSLENIFSLSMKDSGAECRERNVRRLLSMKNDRTIFSDAEKMCIKYNMKGAYLQSCIFDYIATGGSEEFIKNSASFLNDVAKVKAARNNNKKIQE